MDPHATLQYRDPLNRDHPLHSVVSPAKKKRAVMMRYHSSAAPSTTAMTSPIRTRDDGEGSSRHLQQFPRFEDREDASAMHMLNNTKTSRSSNDDKSSTSSSSPSRGPLTQPMGFIGHVNEEAECKLGEHRPKLVIGQVIRDSSAYADEDDEEDDEHDDDDDDEDSEEESGSSALEDSGGDDTRNASRRRLELEGAAGLLIFHQGN